MQDGFLFTAISLNLRSQRPGFMMSRIATVQDCDAMIEASFDAAGYKKSLK